MAPEWICASPGLNRLQMRLQALEDRRPADARKARNRLAGLIREATHKAMVPNTGSRIARGLTLVCGGLLIAIVLLQLQWFVINPWMSIRLAPAFELARGNPIYPTEASGPYVTTLYGFIGPWFYYPWTWISNADWALRAAGVWTVLWTVGIGVYIARRELRRPFDSGEPVPSRGEQAFLLALFVLGIWAMPSLRYSLLEIHSDAPAHVLIAAACLGALRYAETRRTGWLLLFAAAAGTAPWAKQIAVFPLLGAMLWLLLRCGWKAAIGVGAGTTLVGLGLGAIGVMKHGFQTLWFNLVTIPGSQPWVVETARVKIDVSTAEGKFVALRELVTQRLPWEYGPLALLLVGIAGAAWKWGRSRETSFLRAYPTLSLFSMIALFAVPAMALGLVKVGGDVNSAGYVTYPAWIAIVVGAARLIPALKAEGIAKPAALAGCVAIGALALAPMPERIRLLEKPSHQDLQAFMEANPGSIYCPSDPLVHVLTEKVCPPIGDIILSMKLGRHKVTREQFLKAYPGGLKFKYIAYPYFNSGETYIAELFPAYNELAVIDDLPGLRLLKQADSTTTWNPAITN